MTTITLGVWLLQDQSASPVGHVVEVLRELGQIETLLLSLLLHPGPAARPSRSSGTAESPQQRHLLGHLQGLEVEQAHSATGQTEVCEVEVWEETSPPVLVLEDKLRPESSGQAEVASFDETRDELRQFLQQWLVQEVDLGEAVDDPDQEREGGSGQSEGGVLRARELPEPVDQLGDEQLRLDEGSVGGEESLLVEEVVLDGLRGEDNEGVHGASSDLTGGKARLVVVLTTATTLGGLYSTVMYCVLYSVHITVMYCVQNTVQLYIRTAVQYTAVQYSTIQYSTVPL